MQLEYKDTVRPFVAAGAFGFLAILLACIAGLMHFADSRPPYPPGSVMALSFATMCLPCLYFAVRGFRAGRTNAFQDLPQKGSVAAAIALVALGVALAEIGDMWDLAGFPVMSAFSFALCNQRFRDFLYWVALLPRQLFLCLFTRAD